MSGVIIIDCLQYFNEREYYIDMKIEWNKVTWYSKLIALILFVALPFIGFYYGTQYGKTVALVGQPSTSVATSTVTQNSGSSLPPYYSDAAEWQTDSNNTGFSIAYPIDFATQDNNAATASTDWRMNSNNTTGVEYFTLTIPKSFEPQTNLADVTLTVGASKDASAVADCLSPDPSGEGTALSKATINGIQFNVFQSNDAGAGNIYQTTSYRTVHAGECYAIEYTIHSSQLENYPASYNLQPFSQSKIDSLMQNIIGTFKFD